ncbi:hypothetical protein M3Y99_00135800 [Aphelenchoides fujianensis]|nr:hypothetical protein M3Y99_00135800 [Aphelenchoides fujianensis]
MSTVYSATFLVDSRCGRPRGGCPRYCSIELFDSSFCSLGCAFGESAAFWTQTCEAVKRRREDPFFNASMSRTLTNTRKEWRGQRAELFETRGQIVKDAVGITDGTETQAVSVDAAVFVDGWQWDVIDVEQPAGFIGLAPGPENLVLQAFAQQKLAAPVVSFSIFQPLPITLGALSPNCTDWRHVPSLRDDRWVFRADRVEIAGFVFEDELVQIVLDKQWSLVPFEVVRSLLEDGILFTSGKFEGEEWFMTYCNQTLDLNFWLGGHQFVVHLATFDELKAECPAYLSSPLDYPVRRYTDIPQFLLGITFLQSQCLAFDYSTNSIALGALATQ